MSYETRAYDNHHGDPVVILVATGTHDVSRLVNLLAGSRMALCEHNSLADQVKRQVNRHNGGQAALKLLAEHGGPDLLEIPDRDLAAEVKRYRLISLNLARRLADHADCEEHPPSSPAADCPFCGDRMAYLTYVNAGGQDFRPDNSGPSIPWTDLINRHHALDGGETHG